MRCLAGLLGVFLLLAVSKAHVVQRRNYRNTEEILVPVTIIQDGEEIKEPANLKANEKEAEKKNIQPEVIAENIADAAVAAEQKLEAVEAVVETERRIDEAIVEEEIEEAIQAEEIKEREQEQKNKLEVTLPEVPEIVSAAEPVDQAAAAVKPATIVAQSPEQVAVVAEAGKNANNADGEAQQPDNLVRQATQATPIQTTTQQNFVQQFIQNSPLGQFFNQITGQQGANDEPPATFNPVNAVQAAAQSVVNGTTQAFQGFQQFASNLGNQFQSTLSGLTGQPSVQASNEVITVRPPGPIQQLVNTFIPPQAQPAPASQGPFQGLLNIFQGNNRPQQAAATTAIAAVAPAAQPAKEPEIQEQTQTANDEATNEVRDSGEANDSFEESAQPGELIVVSDETTQTENEAEQENANN